MPLTFSQQVRLAQLQVIGDVDGLTSAEVVELGQLNALRAPPPPPPPTRKSFRFGAGPSPRRGTPEYAGDPFLVYTDDTGVRWLFDPKGGQP